MTSKNKSGVKKSAVKKAPKVYVDRKFLNDLAKKIYDYKSKKFIRLCAGHLCEPDPLNTGKNSKMLHCGLGELYYAMTGEDDFSSSVTENDVIETAFDLSSFQGVRFDRDQKFSKILKEIKAMKVPEHVKETLQGAVEDASEESRSEEEYSFRNALNEIPNQNDGISSYQKNQTQVYKDRAKAVAMCLRKAAKFLPE